MTWCTIHSARAKASLDKAYFSSFCQFWALRPAVPIRIDFFNVTTNERRAENQRKLSVGATEYCAEMQNVGSRHGARK